MADLTTNINNLITYINDMKDAINSKGGSITNTTPFSDYATAISNLSSGSTVTTDDGGWVQANLTQDNTAFYPHYESTATVTPTTQWTITDNKASISNGDIEEIYIIKDNSMKSTIYGDKTGSPVINYNCNLNSKRIISVPFTSITAFVPCFANKGNNYSYLLMPIINTTGYTFTSNTMLDVYFTADTDLNLVVYYRLYENSSVTLPYEYIDYGPEQNLSKATITVDDFSETATLTDGNCFWGYELGDENKLYIWDADDITAFEPVEEIEGTDWHSLGSGLTNFIINDSVDSSIGSRNTVRVSIPQGNYLLCKLTKTDTKGWLLRCEYRQVQLYGVS